MPGYKAGGALRTIANMVEMIGDEFNFSIITSDRDFGDVNAYENVVLDQWVQLAKCQVYYMSAQNQSFYTLNKLISETPHDILYLNSFFDPVFTIRPLLCRRLKGVPLQPAIIACRGEFSHGSLAIKKWKKRLYIVLARILGIYRNLTWQASSEHEAERIGHVIGETVRQTVVAPDLVFAKCHVKPDKQCSKRMKNTPLRIVTLLRICQTKNLDYALRIIEKVSVPVIFDIYGPKEDNDYWQLCESIIKGLPSSVRVQYKGSLEHDDVLHTLADYDLFFYYCREDDLVDIIGAKGQRGQKDKNHR